MAQIKVTVDNFYQRAKLLYFEKAEKISQSNTKLSSLIESATEKLKKFAENPQIQEVKAHVDIITRMVKYHINGVYRISNKTLAILAMGLVYFITPIDLIPDFIPMIGYVDDLSVLVAVIKALQEDIHKFMAWENAHKAPIL